MAPRALDVGLDVEREEWRDRGLGVLRDEKRPQRLREPRSGRSDL